MNKRSTLSTHRTSIQTRLREERLRLGFTQSEMASAGRVVPRTYSNYELELSDGGRDPGAAFIAAIAECGVDVLYILTSKRSVEMLLSEDAVVLKPDEAALVDNYRHSPESAKRNLQAVGVAFAQQRVAKRLLGNREHAAAVPA